MKAFCFLFKSVNTNVRTNGVMVGVVISAGIVVGYEIGLGGIGLHIGEDVIDLIDCGFISAKAVEGAANVFGSVHGSKTSVCGKNSLDHCGIRRSVKVTRENVRERRCADILEQKCGLNCLCGGFVKMIEMHVIKAERLIAGAVDQFSAKKDARTIALPHSVQAATWEIFL